MSEKQTISKSRKIIGCVLLSICAAFLIYFAVVMIYRLATVTDGKRVSAFTRFLAEFGFLALLSIPAFDICFGIFTWKRNRVATVVGYVFRTLACAVCVLFVVLGSAIMITGAINDSKPTNNVVVLGLAIDGDELPKDLVHRLEKAIEYKNANPDVRLVATGGNSEDPELSEAAYMVRYLKEHGIADDDKLIAETNAKTTVENFKYSAEFLNREDAVGVITNDYHIFRATKIAKKQGYTNIIKIPAKSEPALYLENAMWEAICSIFETFRGNMSY